MPTTVFLPLILKKNTKQSITAEWSLNWNANNNHVSVGLSSEWYLLSVGISKQNVQEKERRRFNCTFVTANLLNHLIESSWSLFIVFQRKQGFWRSKHK